MNETKSSLNSQPSLKKREVFAAAKNHNVRRSEKTEKTKMRLFILVFFISSSSIFYDPVVTIVEKKKKKAYV